MKLTTAAREFLVEHVFDYDNAEARYPETLPQVAECFTTVAQLKRQVSASGSHFFDSDTMGFFNSRVAPRLIGSRFFITSEQMDHRSPRLWRVRWIAQGTNGHLVAYGFEGRFDTLDKAKRFAKTAHALIPFSPGE